MESKKTFRADIEKGKTIGFMMGLIVALSILFTGFEWGQNDLNVNNDFYYNEDIEELDEIEITRTELPEPPKPETVVAPEKLVIVDEPVATVDIAPTEDNDNHAQSDIFTPPTKEKEVIVDDYIHVNVEQMPEFPGGDDALLKWIAGHISYPSIAAQNGIEGRVSCSFVVNIDGSISDVQVLRSVDPNLDKEAIRVLQSMPKWKPGFQEGVAVRVKFSLPVRFKLQQ